MPQPLKIYIKLQILYIFKKLEIKNVKIFKNKRFKKYK